MRPITIRFRDGFYAGLGLAVVVGFFLIWLWQPDRQVNRHAANLLRRTQARNWNGVASLLATDYSDQWGDDRTVVLARLREIFRYIPNAQLMAIDPVARVENEKGIWRAKIVIQGEGELVGVIEERVNSLATPFELEWRHDSGKPWDWKLVRVGNPELELPKGFE